MKNKELNLVEILKDCPEGTPLYSPICGTVILDSVKDDYIYTYTADKGATVTFFSDGKYMPCPDAECQLFPAKDNRDWESFHICPNFKKGDFVTRIYDNNEHRILLMGDTDWSSPKNHVNFICYVDLGDGAFEVSESHEYWCFVEDFNTCKKFRFATDEEKKKLLIAIINNGYIWDSEKNELFKIEETPKFKKGDIIIHIFHNDAPCILLMDDTDWSSQDNPVRFICYKDLGKGGRFNVSESNSYWCTVGEFDYSTCRPATDLEKYWLIKTMNEHGYVWNEETLELKKKGYEFKPFDKVLVRDEDDEEWLATLFSHKKEGASYPYVCISDCHSQCIPYEGNEHLVGSIESIEID